VDEDEFNWYYAPVGMSGIWGFIKSIPKKVAGGVSAIWERTPDTAKAEAWARAQRIADTARDEVATRAEQARNTAIPEAVSLYGPGGAVMTPALIAAGVAVLVLLLRK